MPNAKKNLRWGVEQRLEFIESRVFWDGGINRSEITEHFGVSVPQASNDLARYNELAPKNLDYDRSEKRYFASDTFKPVFSNPNAEAYLAQAVQTDANGWNDTALQIDRVPIPQRRLDAQILRSILAAIRNTDSVEIEYQSMNVKRPDPLWRRITPHAFGNDGLRWHLRAFCHLENQFKDFLLSRCLGTREEQAADQSAEDDHAWFRFFDVTLIPNPKLSESQQRVIALDYGMPSHELTIPVRCALLYYFEKRLRLDIADRLDKPQETPVVIQNREAFHQAMADAK